jgi:hypothetical protein
MIKQFIRKKDRTKVGVLVAFIEEGSDVVSIGFTKCRKGDTFSNEFGTDVAIKRAKAYVDRGLLEVKVPYAVQDDLIEFADRCNRCFSEAKLPKWVSQFVKIFTKADSPS